ncbi:hypothetical protein HQ533_05065 [Candidatus Woesearchaeota archaeon]|nr:hypothetical protein [Candidatus Woesearchaeota archaeon]
MKDGKVLIVVDNKDLYDRGENIFKSFIEPDKTREKYYKLWLGFVDKMVRYVYSLDKEKLKRMSDKELLKAIEYFHVQYDNFWTYGFIPELSNWGGERLLKEGIKNFDSEEFIEIFEALSAPEDLSFYQVEEMELLKTESLEEHQKKYFWIGNGYGGVRVKTVGEFKKERDQISAEEAKKKIEETETFKSRVKKKKQEVIKKYNLSKEVEKLASKLSFSIWWQDYRKKYIFIALHALTLFAKELGRRNNIKLKDLLWYARRDILALAENKIKVDAEERKKGYLSYYKEKENKCVYFFGKKANEILEPYVHIEVSKDIKDIKGLVVSKGKVKGQVRLLSGARHFDSFKEGNILVTAMTSPDYIVAMRKAAAIVTDEGGVTCHAAIVSRELGIPCIVGTKIATRVLRDGEFVEVDADKGVVRKID